MEHSGHMNSGRGRWDAIAAGVRRIREDESAQDRVITGFLVWILALAILAAVVSAVYGLGPVPEADITGKRPSAPGLGFVPVVPLLTNLALAAVLVVTAGLFSATVAILLRRWRLAEPADSPRIDPAIVALVAIMVGSLLFLLVLSAFILSLLQVPEEPGAGMALQIVEGELPEPPPEEPQQEIPFDIEGKNRGPLIFGIVAVIGLGAALLFAIRLLSQPSGGDADERVFPEKLRRELAAASRSGYADAAAEPDPRRAVLIAYAAMEQAMAHHELARVASETPFEYVERLVSSLEATEDRELAGRLWDRLLMLTRLFEDARFSTHPIDVAAKRRALQLLSDIAVSMGDAP